MDCLLYEDLYKMPLSSNTDIEDSKEWCNGNSSCYGFTVYNFNAARMIFFIMGVELHS